MSKTNKLSEDKMEQNLPVVKQMVRWLSATTEGQYDSVQSVDVELASWYARGYKLFATHFVGNDNQGFGVLYILVREDA